MAKNEPNKPDSVKTKLEESPVKKQSASIQATEVVSNASTPEKTAVQSLKKSLSVTRSSSTNR